MTYQCFRGIGVLGMSIECLEIIKAIFEGKQNMNDAYGANGNF